jgi:hypothetical protein
MDIGSRWSKLRAICAGATLPSRLRRKSHAEKQAAKAELHDWENEGGNPAPSPEATESRVTTGSA